MFVSVVYMEEGDGEQRAWISGYLQEPGALEKHDD